MQGFSPLSVLTCSPTVTSILPFKHVYKFFAFVVVVDTFVRLLRFNGDEKGFQVLVFRTRG